ncbi:MAG: N-formylglutamate amidohydrolase [Thermodesulfobacteriota bacterium]|nr:N-formylglutamate amidohydrolase [Thermodesulfobacteriota bacterium]
MTLPILVSIPHAGLDIPPEVEGLCILNEKEIRKDGDEGAAEIYLPLKSNVAGMVNTNVARAIIDMNRSEDDRRKDGIIKTHTCWDVPVYSEPLKGNITQVLIRSYYRPYHSALTRYATGMKLGIDCHTMASKGPPIGPDPDVRRPPICLSNGDGTCPDKWMLSLAECLERSFEKKVSINHPFKGGYIIKSHAQEMPWIQIELSREHFATDEEKSEHLLKSLVMWHEKIL